jgi:hypothetical protein
LIAGIPYPFLTLQREQRQAQPVQQIEHFKECCLILLHAAQERDAISFLLDHSSL